MGPLSSGPLGVPGLATSSGEAIARAASISTGDVAIVLDQVEKRFGNAPAAVKGLSLEIPAGELVALVGPSGCGKTTTLRMINRLIEPTAGTITVGGVDILQQPPHQLRRGIGYVIQQAGLFPHRTIAANIATVPKLLGWSSQERAARTAELVELVGLDPEVLSRYPAALSGGQQQRVGVARALAADPPVLLMDEPYSAVDPIVRSRLQDELLSLQRRLRKTVVLVTHDIDEAIKLADRIAIMNVGGVIEQYASPADLLRDPANEFVASFLGSERALRRMALLKVADAQPRPGSVVEVSVSVEEAAEVMARHRVDWVAVTSAGHLLGWADQAALEGRGSVGAATLRPFLAEVSLNTGLREALDRIVQSATRVAVVVQPDGTYEGMVTIDDIAEAMAR